MADGHLNKCKECVKAAVKLRRRTNPAVQEYDRERYRNPGRKAHTRQNAERWAEKHPDARLAQFALNNAVRDRRVKKHPCLFCGATQFLHGHHRDYTKPLDVIWLCAKCHHRLHSAFPETRGHAE